MQRPTDKEETGEDQGSRERSGFAELFAKVWDTIFGEERYARNAAGPLMMVIGLIMLLYFASRGILDKPIGALGTTILAISGTLLVGGMIVTYVAVVRRHPATPEIPADPGDLGQAYAQLADFFDVTRSLTNFAFSLSAVFMALGLLVILIGAGRSVLGLGGEASDLTVVAGVIAEFISASALAVYRSNSRRLTRTSDFVFSTWNLVNAYNLTRELVDETRRDDETAKIIAVMTRQAELVVGLASPATNRTKG